MSRQSKKRRRKEEAEREELLAPDAFESQGATWSSWLEKNLKLVVAGVVGVLLAIVIVEIVRSSSASTAAARTAELMDAVEAYQEALRAGGAAPAALTSTAADPKETAPLREARVALQAAIESGGSEELVALARLYDADLARRLGQTSEAVAGFDAYLEVASDDDPLRFFALEGKGYALEGGGQLDAALAVYEQIAAQERYDDYGLKHVARVLESKGDTAGAKAAYEKILAQEPESPLRDFAEQQLGVLPD